MTRSGIFTYKDTGKRIVVVLVGGRASIRIGEDDAFLVDGRYDLHGFFSALGRDKEITGLASVLQTLNQ